MSSCVQLKIRTKLKSIDVLFNININYIINIHVRYDILNYIYTNARFNDIMISIIFQRTFFQTL